MTEATARLGQLMMEDLVSMHMEIRQLFGPEESCFPYWMKWEELKLLPSSLRDVALGKDGGELGGWMPLYRYLMLHQIVTVCFMTTSWLARMLTARRLYLVKDHVKQAVGHVYLTLHSLAMFFCYGVDIYIFLL